MRDPSSFNEFYAGSVHRVTGHVHAMTGNLGEAEDIVQEEFAKARQQWELERRFRVWESTH